MSGVELDRLVAILVHARCASLLLGDGQADELEVAS